MDDRRKHRWISFLKIKGSALFWTASCAALAIFLVLFLYVWPEWKMGPEQPISFSHQVHAGVKQINCRFCHSYVDRSQHPGMPPVEKCLYCHKYIIAEHPEIKKEHNYYNTNTPTPWKKVFYLPEHVFFKHQRHIDREIQCQECHGEVEKMDRLKGVNFKMGFCIKCHREKEGTPLGCWLGCHN
ncbi:MAG: cytochrome c family protein [Desulfobacterales bacterium]|nr:cytochrome c family protein [Desulfobacterales bacterium]